MSSLILSVIIPAFNEEALLPASLQRVRQACDSCAEIAGNYELIVCDNNSTDQTAAIARQSGCLVVFEPINQIARARNTGAGVATGEWLLFNDADSWPSPELMADTAAIMRSTKYIGCGSTIRVVDGPWWFKRAWESKNLSMRLLNWCPGGFILCRRDAFVEIGGFPLDHYIFEEVEFVKRLKKLASKCGQKFTVLHKHPFNASGRKGTCYGFWSWAWTAFRFWLSLGKLAKDKSFASKWYEGQR